MNILICDDDNNYVSLIKKYVQKFFTEHKISDYEIREYYTGEDALKDKTFFDIAFLDVEMGGINGIDVGRELRKRNSNIIIFVITSYMSYLDDAMDEKVFRYINKPIDKYAIIRGMQKAMTICYSRHDKKLMITSADDNVIINQSSIICIESLDRKRFIHTVEGKVYSSMESISYWYNQLDKDVFFMTNKSFIVNVKYVKSFSDGMIEIEGMKNKALLSRDKRKEFKQKVLMYLVSQE